MGCFAFDEIDSGLADMKRKAAARRGEKPPPTLAAKPAQEKARPSSSEWWRTARTLSSRLQDPTIVRCHLRGTTQFMRRNDCEARGGRAG